MSARLPLRWRLALAFAGAMAVLLLAAGLFLRISLGEELEDGVDGSLRARSDDLAALVARTGGDDLGLTGAARLSEAGEGVAQLLDGSGRVIDASPPVPAARALLPDDAVVRARTGIVTIDARPVPGIDGRARLLARPVPGTGGDRIVVVGASLESRDEAVAGLVPLLLVLGPVALLIASALGYAVAAAALRPVEAMRAEAAGISGAPGGVRLPVPEARDELRDLGETLNAMLERIDVAVSREREFVADAGHELRTPVAILKAEIDLALAGDRSAEELRAALVSAGEETARLARLSDDLLALARSEEHARHPREEVAAGDLLDAVARRFRRRAEAAGRAIVVAAPPGLALTIDRGRMEEALGNLIDNALRHGSGDVRLDARETDDGAELSVSDQGPGFDPEFVPRAFERFSRPQTGRTGGGLGLGLAVVRAIARLHGGDAEAEASVEGGRVTIRLPREPRRETAL